MVAALFILEPGVAAMRSSHTGWFPQGMAYIGPHQRDTSSQFLGQLGSEYRTNKVSLGENQLPDKKIQVHWLAEQETSKSTQQELTHGMNLSQIPPF